MNEPASTKWFGIKKKQLGLVGVLLVVLGYVLICCGETLNGVVTYAGGTVLALFFVRPKKILNFESRHLVQVGGFVAALGLLLLCCGATLSGAAIFASGVCASVYLYEPKKKPPANSCLFPCDKSK